MKALNGAQKASILLLSLEPDIAAKVMRNLDEEEIEAITQTVNDIDLVPQDVMEGVLGETKEYLKRIGPLYQSRQFIQKVVNKVLGEKRTEEVDQALDSFSSDSIGTNFDTRMLATLIQDEHPQIVALIISCLTPASAKEIISELPDSVKANVLYRISNMQRIPPEVLKEVQKTLKEKIATSASTPSQQKGGLSKVVEIVKSLDFKTLETILNELRGIDPDLASVIEAQLFTFEDLVGLDDRSLQLLLREIDMKDLSMALKTASEELKDKFLKNLSERAREMLIEDMEVMGPVRVKDIEGAQQRIVDAAKRLESEGKIILRQGGEEGDVFV